MRWTGGPSGAGVAGVEPARITELFDLGAAPVLSPGPVAAGKQGKVWLLETTDGRWAVKIPDRRWDLDELVDGFAFQEAAHAYGVPTPRIRRTVDGAVVDEIDGVQLRVYEWLDLRTPDALIDPAELGTVLARLHQVPADVPGAVHPWYREPVGAAAWDELVHELRAAGAPFAGELAALRDELVALESWLEPPAGVRFCHCDLWADNVRAGPGERLYVIDWDNSGAADPGQELAMALYEYGRTDPGRARAVISAYEAAGGPGRVREPGQFAMLIAMLGHINQLAARSWLQAAPGSPQRPDAEAWIRESLDDPHTRDRLLELLRTIS
jgi:Ser/Thr protein kinase RdoA (MazF antagonist)